MATFRKLRRSIGRGKLGYPKLNARPIWGIGWRPVGAQACRAYMHQCRLKATEDRLEARALWIEL